jgi:hypothetical protein
VGQTGSHFSVRYKEHQKSFRDKTDSSSFSKHVNEKAYSFGPINNVMETLHYQGKGTHLNTIERFYIHTQFTANNHLNDPQTVSPNAIFDALTKGHRPQ